MFGRNGKEVELTDEVIRLKNRISELEIQEAKIREEHAREDRELRHMIGLEKKRQEVEVEQAKTAAVLAVKEENLTAQRTRFNEDMAFREKRFTEEVGYLKDLMGQILERLPFVNVDKKAK